MCATILSLEQIHDIYFHNLEWSLCSYWSRAVAPEADTLWAALCPP